MNKFFTLLMILFIFTAGLYADFTSSKWAYRKSLNSLPEGIYGEWIVDNEVHLRCDLNLNSIRLIDEQNAEVPYVIVKKYPSTETKNVPCEILNLSDNKSSISFNTDIGIKRRFHNELEINLSGENYRLPVIIEGSNDRKKWTVIRKKAFILNYNTDYPVKSSRIKYNRSDYRFLHITINNVSGLIKFSSAKLYETIHNPGDIVIRKTSIISNEIKKTDSGKDSIIVLDLGQTGLSHQEASVVSGSLFYSRSLDVYVRNNPETQWSYTGSGKIYKYGNEINNTIQYNEKSNRYIKIVIHNYDDKPIDIKNIIIKGVPSRIIFPVHPAPHYLYYGNDSARKPKYDFEKKWSVSNKIPAGEIVRFGSEEKSPEFKNISKSSFLEDNPWIIYIGLGLGIFVLGLIAVRMFKSPEENNL